MITVVKLKSAVFIPDEPGPTISSVPVVDALCNGSLDGSITVNANGGTGILSFSIDNGTTNQSSNTFNNLAAGTYDIMAQYANGCTSVSQVNVLEPTPLQLNSNTNPSTCGNSNGEITVNAAGGIAPYQFNINGGANQASSLFSNLLAGNYNVIVTDDHGCTFTLAVAVSDLPPPVINSVPVVDALCNGDNTGSLTSNT